MENKKEKKKVNKIRIKDLSQSAVLNPNPKIEIPDTDYSDYLNDLLQNSQIITILGDNKTEPQKKKKIKKIIKKKGKKRKNTLTNQTQKIELDIKESETKNNKTEVKEKDNKKEKKIENKNNNDSNTITNISNEKQPSKNISTNVNQKGNKNDESKDNDNNNDKNSNSKNIKATEEKKENEIKEEDIKKEGKTEEKDNNNKKDYKIEKIIKNISEKDLLAFDLLIKGQILLKIKNVLKILYFFLKIQKCQKDSCQKIIAMYRGYSVRENFKLNYLTKKILMLRDSCASKIIAYYKGYLIRKLSKKILEKKEDNYIIYSTLSNNKMLYLKISFISGIEDNIYFEYCKLLNCFIYYLNRRENNISKTKVEGYFYNEKYKKLTDDMYEKNKKGENIINFPKIIKKNDENIEKYDKIINEYMKDHRYAKRKRENILDYEERKRKALDDEMLQRHKKFEKLNKTGRSKSFMRLKGVMKNKGILKPSKSYINLRSDDKRIQFGMAKIKKYHLLKQ